MIKLVRRNLVNGILCNSLEKKYICVYGEGEDYLQGKVQKKKKNKQKLWGRKIV